MPFRTLQALGCICLAGSEQAMHPGGAKLSAGPVGWPHHFAHIHGPHLPGHLSKAAYDMSRSRLKQRMPPACILNTQHFGHVQVVDLEARLCHSEAELAQSVADSQAEIQAQLIALQLVRADQVANQELCQHAELQQALLLTQLRNCQVGSLYVLCMPAEAVCVPWLSMLSRRREQVLLQDLAGFVPLSYWSCSFLNAFACTLLQGRLNTPCSASCDAGQGGEPQC